MRRSLPRRVEVTAHAKLNLGLAVGPPRADGFHDLATVFQSVSLADTLVARRTARGFRLRVRAEGVDAAHVPGGAENLVVRAARLVATRLDLRGGAEFHLTKRIPARAGMGGGSADAAAAIVAMLALHGTQVTRSERLTLAAALGSDVPFAITGGTALGLGRGERLTPLRLARPFRVLVVVPRWRISTSEAFRRIDRAKYGLTLWKPTLRFAASLGRNRVTASRTARLGNTFERVLGARRRDFEKLRARMRAAGLLEPRLTGSGSGVFGIVPPGVQARKLVGRFREDGSVFVVRTVGRGLKIRTQT
jgi:4-diphosphocytidyl-2-C-methyl-D-erythritol kinase